MRCFTVIPDRWNNFSRMLAYALETSDEYAWLWNECGKWWDAPMEKIQEDRVTLYHKRPMFWTDSVPGINSMIEAAVDPVGVATRKIAAGTLPNLAANPSFEQVKKNGSAQAWETWIFPTHRAKTSVVAVKQPGVGFGDDSALCVSDSPRLAASSQSFAVRPGERYLFSGYSRSSGRAFGSLNADFGRNGRKTHRKEIVIGAVVPVAGSEWLRHCGIAEIPAGYDRLWVNLFATTSDGGKVYFDKIAVYKLEDNPADIRTPRHKASPKLAAPEWIGNADVKDLRSGADWVAGTAVGVDPVVEKNNFKIDADKYNIIRMTVTLSPGPMALCQIYWAGPGQGFSEKRTAGVRVAANGKPQECQFFLPNNKAWQGQIVRFRIDPLSNRTKQPCAFRIENVRFQQGKR